MGQPDRAAADASRALQERQAYIRRGLVVALARAQAHLAAVRREDYAEERVFKSVLTHRRRAVHRVERLLNEFSCAPS